MSKARNIQIQNENPSPTKSRFAQDTPATPSVDNLIFGKKNYTIMLIGVALIILGFALMSGGHMPSSDVWDDGLIYSTRITVIAPIIVLLGLGLQVVAIFSKRN